jgi:hypothetical protein
MATGEMICELRRNGKQEIVEDPRRLTEPNQTHGVSETVVIRHEPL